MYPARDRLPPSRPRPGFRQRFEHEARAIYSLNHPRICTVHDVGSQDGVDFLVMEYLEGETLGGRLQKGPLPIEQAFKVAVQLAGALEMAHRAGIATAISSPAISCWPKRGQSCWTSALRNRPPPR